MRRCRTTAVLASAGMLAALFLESMAAADPADWAPVGQALGAPGELGKDGVYKVTVLRTDPAVKNSAGLPVPAGLGLNSYAAFAGTPAAATVVGDTCLLEHEVNPALDALRAGGIEVVAIHNHMLGEEPRLIFMHFEGRGEAVALARTVRRAWDEIGKPNPPEPGVQGPPPQPNWDAVAATLGRPGSAAKDGTYKVTLARSDLSLALDGQGLPAGVGLACWVAFWPCPCGRTMAMGDTCVTRRELQGCIDALRRGGIRITGLHNHLLGTSGEVMFMHFSGEGDAMALAKTVRAAWDLLPVPKPPSPPSLPPAGPPVSVLDSESEQVGRSPAGFSTGSTGGGGPVAWSIRSEEGAPNGTKVVARTSADATEDRFPLCIHDEAWAKDVSASVEFEAVSGNVDRSAGPVVRLLDGVFLDGRLVVSADDTTSSGADKTGLWTKADSVTCFDHHRIQPR